MDRRQQYDVTVVLVINADTPHDAILHAEALVALGADFSDDDAAKLHASWIDSIIVTPGKETA